MRYALGMGIAGHAIHLQLGRKALFQLERKVTHPGFGTASSTSNDNALAVRKPAEY